MFLGELLGATSLLGFVLGTENLEEIQVDSPSSICLSRLEEISVFPVVLDSLSTAIRENANTYSFQEALGSLAAWT